MICLIQQMAMSIISWIMIHIRYDMINITELLIIVSTGAAPIPAVVFSDTQASSTHCPPPRCTAIPPPPPPPRPLDDPALNAQLEAWRANWNSAQKAEAAGLKEARAALARTPGFAPNSVEWLAARDAVIHYSESRERLDELRREFRRFQSNAFPSASRSDQTQLAKVWEGLGDYICRTEKDSTELLLSLISQ